jgi:hypothetical protein
MVEYRDLTWKKDKLYLGGKYTSVYIVEDESYDFMYWLHWNFEKPEKSVNSYNLTNTKDNGKVLYLKYINNIGERAH